MYLLIFREVNQETLFTFMFVFIQTFLRGGCP